MDPLPPALLLPILKALAHESRLRLIGLIAAQERNVGELAGLVGLEEPTVSHHLSLLRDAGLVRVRQAGTTRWYGLEAETLTRLGRDLADPDRVARLAEPEPPSALERRVLANFLQADGTISTIPASRKKRRALLAVLVQDFEPDHRFPESAINERLKRRHWDCATLRREFIGYRMMARADGIYWRLPEAEWVTE